MTSPPRYADRITGALDQSDPALTVSKVKEVVANELMELDPTMRVEATQFFNHSFSPDFVASWPDDTTKPRRFVYLKISSKLDYLLEDVGLVADQHPIVFGLSATPEGSEPLRQEVHETSRRSDTLLTDADGLQEIIAYKDVPFVGLAGSAVAQGGRGILDHDAGKQTVDRLVSGFDGALAVDAGPTLAAAEALGDVLTEEYADRMTRLLQAVWVGAGGKLEEFPGSPLGLGQGVTNEALEFLLQYDEISDLRFWRRLGQGITLHQIGRLSIPGSPKNLQHFVKANIGTLSTRACRVIGQEQLMTQDVAPSEFTWFIDGDRGLLSLRGPGFIAQFGSNVSDLGRPDRRIPGISISELVARTQYATVIEADISARSGKRRTIKLFSGDGSNLISDLAKRTTFPELGAGAVPVVRRAGVALDGGPGGRVLSCDFQTSTAYRRTSSKISLAEIAGEGIPVLHHVSREELKKVAELVQNDVEPVLFYVLALLNGDEGDR